MEFQYTDKTKQMFEDIKKSIPEFPDILDICVDTTCQSMVKLISKKYDDFVREEFEKCGYTLEELQSGRHKLYRTIKPIGDRKKIHNYFVDGECILEFLCDFDISDGIFIRFIPIPYENY